MVEKRTASINPNLRMNMTSSEFCEIKLDVKEEEVETIVPDCGSPLPLYGSLEPKYESLQRVQPIEEKEVEENPILAGYLFKANPCGTRDHCSALVQNLRKELTEALTKLKAEQKRNQRLQTRNNELERKNKYLQQCLDMQSGRETIKERDGQQIRSETSESERQKIISLHMANIQAKDISRMLNVHKTTVYRWIKRHEENENLKNLPRSGAPRRKPRKEDRLTTCTSQQPLTNVVAIRNKIKRNGLHAAGIHKNHTTKTFST
ncbi:uncharacterized protein LOC143035223 [Oratosquilla oratoria]|uniref:uncharacterized protein LOC143035223 n=1 Tax=Oratosquilla oratoria TaxID=337810 RepID=UPI003F75B1DD